MVRIKSVHLSSAIGYIEVDINDVPEAGYSGEGLWVINFTFDKTIKDPRSLWMKIKGLFNKQPFFFWDKLCTIHITGWVDVGKGESYLEVDVITGNLPSEFKSVGYKLDVQKTTLNLKG